MTEKAKAPDTPKLVCQKCQQEMTMGKVIVSYLGAKFPIELLK